MLNVLAKEPAQEVFTVIDFETTGLLTDENVQAIEVGAIKFTADGREMGRLSMMIKLNEGNELPPFITELTGITERDIRNGAPEPNALLTLTAFIGGSTVIAQNAPFDLGILARGQVFPSFFICTRALSKMIDPSESASLKNVHERLYGEPVPNHHRAVNDCEATMRIFLTQVERAEAKGIARKDYQNVVLEEPTRPLIFTPYMATTHRVDS